MFEKARWFLQDHKYEMIIGCAMFALAAIPVLLAGGDIGEVIARRRR